MAWGETCTKEDNTKNKMRDRGGKRKKEATTNALGDGVLEVWQHNPREGGKAGGRGGYDIVYLGDCRTQVVGDEAKGKVRSHTCVHSRKMSARATTTQDTAWASGVRGSREESGEAVVTTDKLLGACK